MGKIYSCRWLNYGGLFLSPSGISHCCIVTNDSQNNISGQPFICTYNEDDRKNMTIDNLVDKILQAKLDLIYKINNNVKCECTNCHQIIYREWEPVNRETFKIHRLVMASDSLCNANCIYCGQDHKHFTTFDVSKLLNDFIDAKALKKDDIYWVNWSGGEPTLIENFEEIYDMLADGCKNIIMHTSGIKYSPAIAKNLANKDNASLVISIDSGSSETYKKIKRVDQYDKVVHNIKKYYDASIKKSSIGIKYLIAEGINSSFEEIDKFFDMIVANNLFEATIYISIDILNINITDKLIIAILYFNARCIVVTGKSPIDHGNSITIYAKISFDKLQVK